jgi:hypothetical protein
VKFRERWSYGASVCVYFAFLALVGLGATALCAALWIVPVEALFGDFTNGGIRDGLIVTAIIVIPVFMSFAMEHVPKPGEAEEFAPPN